MCCWYQFNYYPSKLLSFSIPCVYRLQLDNAQKEAEKGFMTFWENTVGEAKQSELYMKQVIEQNNVRTYYHL